jgi:hypothetical protein
MHGWCCAVAAVYSRNNAITRQAKSQQTRASSNGLAANYVVVTSFMGRFYDCKLDVYAAVSCMPMRALCADVSQLFHPQAYTSRYFCSLIHQRVKQVVLHRMESYNAHDGEGINAEHNVD